MQEALGTDAWTGRRRYVIRMGFCRTSRISEVTQRSTGHQDWLRPVGGVCLVSPVVMRCSGSVT